ncbi:ABC transporter ATP-binding protein [Eisenbergiella sp.]
MNKLTLRERFFVTARGYHILKKYCPGLASGKAVTMLITALQPFVSIWFSAQIINELTGQRRVKLLLFYVGTVLFCNLVISMLRSVLERVTSEKQAQMWDFFQKVFTDKQLSMDYVDLENAKILQQRKSAEENLFMFGNGLGQLVWGTEGLVRTAVNIVVSLCMSVTLFTKKTGSGLLDSPLCIFAILLCILFGGWCSSRASVKENKAFETWSKENVRFYRAFDFFGCDLCMKPEYAKDARIYEQNHAADRAFEKMQLHDREQKHLIRRMSWPEAWGGFLASLSNAACYLFVVAKAALGAFGVGSIVQYVGVLTRLGEGLQEAMFMYTDNAVCCSHLQGLYAFLDIPNKKYQGSLPIEKRAFCDCDDNDYEIEFCDVSFKYPGSDVYALRHISLKFCVGERLAAVGRNGSGKTTFIKLLCRLYDPTEGKILLNGIDIQKYNYDEYMSIFSVVFQDFKLFSFSLGQNVAANTDYDKPLAEYCLKKAGFGERLSQMPNGTDTCLYKDFSENGVEISGGEAQKIALARALYKDAPFIVLDEPTAALDPIAEAEVYSKFNEIVGQKTAIYISHRLSSCRFCDEIIVFDHGQITQKGRHDDLVADVKGKYAELWRAQAQYYEK